MQNQAEISDTTSELLSPTVFGDAVEELPATLEPDFAPLVEAGIEEELDTAKDPKCDTNDCCPD